MARPIERRIDVDGFAFKAYSSPASGARSAGSDRATAPVHVLIHGIGASHRYLSLLHDELAQHGEVHSIDLPGFAGLPKPDHAPSVEEMATALARAIDRLDIPRSVLVGHSMGSQWVVELAVQRPDLAAGVVLIGPVSDNEHRSLRAQAVALGLDTLIEPPHVNVVVFQDYLRSGPIWFLREARPMVTYPIEQRVAEVEAPVLVIRGGRDPIAGTAWCRRLRDRAMLGRFAVVPGHGHVVQHSAPRAVASAVRSLETGR
ncbi:alpha/beta fold hydrolase [Herbiconiux sp. P15]|uniref:alpha/beta fold hydrolase n=1 Tax=Herbiconiux liukaitaii TaxID=3342799 RepID=UPI0035B7AFE7